MARALAMVESQGGGDMMSWPCRRSPIVWKPIGESGIAAGSPASGSVVKCVGDRSGA